jgi:hypothetical protein
MTTEELAAAGLPAEQVAQDPEIVHPPEAGGSLRLQSMTRTLPYTANTTQVSS